jgi:hypothetical protein
MTHIQPNYEEFITKLKQEGTDENKRALAVLQIDHNTFVEVLEKRLSNQPYVVPFVNVICDEQLSERYGKDRIFLDTIKGKIKNIASWDQFVTEIRNYFIPPISDSVSLDPTPTQLTLASKRTQPTPAQSLNPDDENVKSRSIEPPGRGRGGRKSRAKPRRKTNKNRTRRKSIKKLHRRK